ncbi:Phosphorylated carbohydrates phosphatase [Hordeum vulgare]|nr:Phosphorylated carbohydrates phosphatase [Hordeum vulgare]
MIAEKEVCLIWQKNAKALRLAIDQSECEAKEATTEAAWFAKLKQEQDKTARRIKEIIALSDSNDDDNNDDGCTSDNDDQDPASATDAYSCAGDWKCKGPMRKCIGHSTSQSDVSLDQKCSNAAVEKMAERQFNDLAVCILMEAIVDERMWIWLGPSPTSISTPGLAVQWAVREAKSPVS